MGSSKTALLVITALLAPGGAVLLVWMLCRRFLASRGSRP